MIYMYILGCPIDGLVDPFMSSAQITFIGLLFVVKSAGGGYLFARAKYQQHDIERIGWELEGGITSNRIGQNRTSSMEDMAGCR